MPITIQVASHGAREVFNQEPPLSAEQLFSRACTKEYRHSTAIIQSSFEKFSTTEPTYPSSNAFVKAAIAAYSSHHHLILRPEDIWFAILTQLGFFVNAHAEELRSFFVSHEGKKHLEVFEVGTIYSVDFGAMAIRMTDLIAKYVNDQELRTWIMPNFSTTTDTDKVVSAILMMGALQKYFSYEGCCTTCGIPSVTLLGVRADWQEMLNRLEMLPRLGNEPNDFYNKLKPVLRHFVASFDSSSDFAVVDFWSKIADESRGSGSHRISGWITAFCFWDETGKRLGWSRNQTVPPISEYSPEREFDATMYPSVEIKDIPAGYATVLLKVNDSGTLYDTMMLAGSVGTYVTSSGDNLDTSRGHRHIFELVSQSKSLTEPPGQPGLDTIQPATGWWMYEVSARVDDENKQAGQKSFNQSSLQASEVEGSKSIPRWRKSYMTKKVKV